MTPGRLRQTLEEPFPHGSSGRFVSVGMLPERREEDAYFYASAD